MTDPFSDISPRARLRKFNQRSHRAWVNESVSIDVMRIRIEHLEAQVRILIDHLTAKEHK